MLRPILALLVLAALVLASASAHVPAPGAEDAAEAPRTKSIGQLIVEGRAHWQAEHAGHPESPPLPPVDPVAEARRVLREERILGATPVQWAETADPERLLALRPAGAGAPRELVAEALRIHAALGVPVTAADVLSMRAQADALPAGVRGPFADLVGAVADAYEAQSLLARDMGARLATMREPHAVLSQDERDATFARAEAVLAAQNRFRDLVELDALPRSSAAAPLFSDPEGLVILGGLGDDAYARGGLVMDPVLVVEPAGNDTYRTSAGGACPSHPVARLGFGCNLLALSVVVDRSGNDTYVYDGFPSVVQGAGAAGGLGILVDVSGDDRYGSTMTRGASPPVFSYVDGVAQGAGQAGVGILLDARGNDEYRADVRSQTWDVWDLAHGFGSLGGLGIATDAQGDDRWLSNGLGLKGAGGFQGVYTDGTGFYGGVGILRDSGGGDDAYHATNVADNVDYYAQGFAAYGGLGVFYEDGGDDDYEATQEAQDPYIVPLLNCAFGTGSFGGVGVFLEMGGSDRYFGDSRSPLAAETMNEGMGNIGAAYGLFVDLSGDDGHFMHANGGPGSATAGRGVLLHGGQSKNIAGTYLDLNGLDAYAGAPPSRDGGLWTAGADVNGPALTAREFLQGG